MNKAIRITIIIAMIILVVAVFANAIFSITNAIEYMQYSSYAFFGAFLVISFCIGLWYLIEENKRNDTTKN